MIPAFIVWCKVQAYTYIYIGSHLAPEKYFIYLILK